MPSVEQSLQNVPSRHARTPAPRTRRAVRAARRGFSLIELVIVVVIIGIIAAIAIPRMSRGSAGAADSAVMQNVSILRNAIDMYQTEHNGSFPTASGSISVADLLLKFSDVTGTNVATAKDTSTGVIYGPYLRMIPPITVGQYKGANGIDTAAGPGVGWIYDSTAGTITPDTGSVTTDSAGKAYSSY